MRDWKCSVQAQLVRTVIIFLTLAHFLIWYEQVNTLDLIVMSLETLSDPWLKYVHRGKDFCVFNDGENNIL